MLGDAGLRSSSSAFSSGIASSKLSTSVSQPETLVYSWYLPETAVHLYTVGGQLETRAVNHKTKKEIVTPLPHRSPLIYAEVLITHYLPEVTGDGNIVFNLAEKPQIDWIVDSAQGKIVRKIRLLKCSSDYMWVYSDSQAKTSHRIPFDHVFIYNEGRKAYHERYFKYIPEPFSLFFDPLDEAYLPLFFFSPRKLKIETSLSYLADCVPVKEKTRIVANNTLLLHVKKTQVLSKISKKEVVIDRAYCGVTLVDTGQPTFTNPFTLGGHAALFVEELNEKGEYVMHKAHLVATKDGKLCNVILIHHFDIERQHIDHQTDTWLVEKEKVKKMMGWIEWQIRNQDGIGQKRAPYGAFGERGGHVGKVETFKTKQEAEYYCKKHDGEGLEHYKVLENSQKTFDVVRSPQNCMDWAELKLEVLGIRLEPDNRWISTLMNLPKVRF